MKRCMPTQIYYVDFLLIILSILNFKFHTFLFITCHSKFENMINISTECAAILLSRPVLTMWVVHCGAMVHVLFLMLIENNLQKTVKKEMFAVSVMWFSSSIVTVVIGSFRSRGFDDTLLKYVHHSSTISVLLSAVAFRAQQSTIIKSSLITQQCQPISNTKLDESAGNTLTYICDFCENAQKWHQNMDMRISVQKNQSLQWKGTVMNSP